MPRHNACFPCAPQPTSREHVDTTSGFLLTYPVFATAEYFWTPSKPDHLMSTTGVQTVMEVDRDVHARANDVLERTISPSPSVDSKKIDSDTSNTFELNTLEKVPSRTSHDPREPDAVLTRQMRITARLHFATCCFCLFLAGWNDGTTGPLLLRIQDNYRVRTTVFVRRA